MEPADKFDRFLTICKWVFIIILIVKIITITFGFATFSWWFVSLPIIIPALMIFYELGAFN